MIILICLLFIFLGFGFSYYLTENKELSLASSFMMTLFLSNSFWVVSDYFHLLFSKTALIIFYFVSMCLLLLIFFSRKDLFFAIKESWNSFKINTPFVIILIFTFAFLLRNQSQVLWAGDGMGIWSSRALEWSNLKSLSFEVETMDRLKTWINYPIFHSLSIMTAQILFFSPKILSSNNFDSFFILGIVFSLYYFFSFFILEKKRAWLLSILITFSLRDLISMVGSAYADLFVCYSFTLVTAVFVRLINGVEKRITLKEVIFYGILFTSLALSKSEGLYRILILFGSFLIVKRLNSQTLKVFISLIFCLLLYAIYKVVNPGYSEYVHYLSDIKLNMNFLQERVSLVLMSFWLSFWDHSYILFKSYRIHLLLSMIFPFFIITVIKKEERATFLFLFLSLILNLSFNYAPFVVTHLEGEIFNNPKMIASAITSRLNLQIAFLAFMISGYFFKDFINRRYKFF